MELLNTSDRLVLSGRRGHGVAGGICMIRLGRRLLGMY